MGSTLNPQIVTFYAFSLGWTRGFGTQLPSEIPLIFFNKWSNSVCPQNSLFKLHTTPNNDVVVCI